MEERQEVVYTGAIPQCPHCEKPTKRTGGIGGVTLVYYPPVYDENGENINPDRNTRTSQYHCHECDKDYVVAGNDHDGYKYC